MTDHPVTPADIARLEAVAQDYVRVMAERDNALAEVARLRDNLEQTRANAEFWHDQYKLAADMAAGIADLDEQAPALRQMLRTERQRRKAEDARNISLEAARDALAAQLERAERVVEATEAALVDAQVATSAVYNRIIAVLPEDSVREAWHRATCWACDWNTTGSDGVCEDAAHEHVADVHVDQVAVAQDAIGLLCIPLRAAVDTYRAATPSTPEPAP